MGITADHIVSIIGYIVAPITGVVMWYAGRRKTHNDFLQEMQVSINMLSQKNTELVQQVIDLNMQIIELKKENAQLRAEIEELSAKMG